MVPSYILILIPPLFSEISDYPLGNNRNISLSFNMTIISQKCIVYHHPQDYVMALKKLLKTYQLQQP